jgi:hypothetical protein
MSVWNVRAAKRILSLTQAVGWAAYNPHHGGDLRGRPFFSVGGFARSKAIPASKFTPQHVHAYIRANRALLAQSPLLGVGTWRRPSDGAVELDIIGTPRNRGHAALLGKALNQNSVGDLLRGKNLPYRWHRRIPSEHSVCTETRHARARSESAAASAAIVGPTSSKGTLA